MTSALIGRFCTAAELATRDSYEGFPLTRYHAELVVPEAVRHKDRRDAGSDDIFNVAGEEAHVEEVRRNRALGKLVHGNPRGAGPHARHHRVLGGEDCSINGSLQRRELAAWGGEGGGEGCEK